MEIGDWKSTEDLVAVYRSVRELGLETNIAEHDAFGFTVVPPPKVAELEFSIKLLKAVLQQHAQRTGHEVKMDELSTASLEGDAPIAIHGGLIGSDPVFEEALNNPTVLALAHYFCGRSVLLSDCLCIIKRRDETPSHLLHIDQAASPSPLPTFPQWLNVTWPLTPYSMESGPIAIVPSSHRFGRRPEPYEAEFLLPNAPVKPIPVECDAGSLIAFCGTTWHAAYPRTSPGLRVTLVMTFCRPFMRQMRDFSSVPQVVLERNSPEFAQMLGIDSLLPMKEGQQGRAEQFTAYRNAGRSPWS